MDKKDFTGLLSGAGWVKYIQMYTYISVLVIVGASRGAEVENAAEKTPLLKVNTKSNTSETFGTNRNLTRNYIVIINVRKYIFCCQSAGFQLQLPLASHFSPKCNIFS